MRRAEQPITREEIDAEDADYYPDITAERKPEDHGRFDGRIVALDYGLPNACMVTERRAYYASSERR